MRLHRLVLGGLAVYGLTFVGACNRAWSDPAPAPVTPTTATAPAAPKKQPFEDDIVAFENADKKTPPPTGAILFTGSSSIRFWTTVAQDFPELTVMNRGFGGSQISDNIRYVDRIVIPYKPKLIVFYAGTNDVDAGKEPTRVLSDFQEYVAKVRAALPNTRIAYISINPSVLRWKQEDKILETNRLIGNYIRENDGKVAPMTFIDTHSFLLSLDGKPRPEILRPDGLHLNAHGYELWSGLLRPQILALAGVEAAKPKAEEAKTRF